VKVLRGYLGDDRHDEDDRKNAGAHEIADIHGHRHGVAAGLAEGRGQYFDNPEKQSHLGYFAEKFLFSHDHFSALKTSEE
jgi:hypothetical protein